MASQGTRGWSSWVHGGSLGVGKAKADGFEMRNLMKSPTHRDGRDTRSFVKGYSLSSCSSDNKSTEPYI